MTDKKPLNLFIDTNILLGFYRYSKDDLTKLNQLEDLIVKTSDINLIVTSQQVDEFYRNRDKIIADVVKELSTAISIPQLFSGHTDYKAIKKQAEMIRAEVERVKNETLEAAKNGSLKADAIISRLFKDAIVVDAAIIAKAKRRSDVGNPPGKAGRIGKCSGNFVQHGSFPVQDDDVHSSGSGRSKVRLRCPNRPRIYRLTSCRSAAPKGRALPVRVKPRIQRGFYFVHLIVRELTHGKTNISNHDFTRRVRF